MRPFRRPQKPFRYSLHTTESSAPLFREAPSVPRFMRAAFYRLLKRFRRMRTRTIRGSSRRPTVVSERSGRPVRTIPYIRGVTSLAPYASMFKAVSRGDYRLSSGTFAMHDDDLVGWKRSERQSLTLVLIVDVSRSTFPFIAVFAETISSLTGYFKMYRDRIGLIALQGTQAAILNHPTHNYRIVTKNLLRLSIRGETPLADGLLKALAMVRLERQRKPGSRSVAILLSDCHPEPLTGACAELFEEPAYRESLRAATLFRKNRVALLMINPSFHDPDKEPVAPGAKLAVRMAATSGGRLVRLFRASASIEQSAQPPTRQEIRLILGSLQDILNAKPQPGDLHDYLH